MRSSGKNLLRSALLLLSCLLTVTPAAAQKTKKAPSPPKVLSTYLTPGVDLIGEIVVVLPPKEIQKYITLVKESAKKHPEWFKEYSEKSKPGIPLAYDEKLGLTKKDYQKYRELWDKREFKSLHKVALRLEESNGKWMVRVSGAGSRISLLRYDTKKDVMVSTNGDMKRIDDIDAAAESILGAWKGQEWKFEEEGALGKTKENFAIGHTNDKKYGLIVYRLQDISSTGRQLFDQSMVIRFAMKKAK